MRGFKIDGFMIGLVGAVVLAILWPSLGASDGFAHADAIATYGVSIVFFLYGLTLAPERMRAGLVHWRLHLIVQSGTFILFPVVVLFIGLFVADYLPDDLWTGFFFLAALPSTVSSSVAMTSLARGNVPAAIFNASASSLIGVVVTPVLMAWFAHASGDPFPLGPVLIKIFALLVLPIVVGQIARHWLARFAARHIRAIKIVDRVIILIIVLNSFSDSVASGIWSQQEPIVIAEILLGVNALFFLVYALMKIPCRIMGFDREDTITALFCGSKKSLATGVPMAKLMFGAAPGLGLIIAPIMLYHFCQLVIVSVIANRYANDGTSAAGKPAKP